VLHNFQCNTHEKINGHHVILCTQAGIGEWDLEMPVPDEENREAMGDEDLDPNLVVVDGELHIRELGRQVRQRVVDYLEIWRNEHQCETTCTLSI